MDISIEKQIVADEYIDVVLEKPHCSHDIDAQPNLAPSSSTELVLSKSVLMVPQTGSPTPFPKLGIKLSYLLTDFLAMCGGRAALEGKTTRVQEENHRVGKTVLLRVFE